MVDAFQSAPSPMIGGPAGGQDRRDSGRMQGVEEEENAGQLGGAEARILIYSSKLHNPGGKSSYVGL